MAGKPQRGGAGEGGLGGDEGGAEAPLVPEQDRLHRRTHDLRRADRRVRLGARRQPVRAGSRPVAQGVVRPCQRVVGEHAFVPRPVGTHQLEGAVAFVGRLAGVAPELVEPRPTHGHARRLG